MGTIKAGTPGNIKKLKSKLKESAGGDKWFWRVPADGEVTVRFLADPWDFTYFDQHYMGSGKDFKSFPCSEDDCIGCDEGADVNKVWVAPVVEIGENRVRVLQVPKGVVDELTAKSDRSGTIMNRDWIIIREGSGKENTKYYLDSETPKKMDLSRFAKPDILAMLEAQLAEAVGAEEEEDEPPRRSRSAKASKKVAKRTSSTRRSKPADDVWAADEDEDDEEAPWDQEEPPRRSRKLAKKVTRSASVKKTVRKPLGKGLRR